MSKSRSDPFLLFGVGNKHILFYSILFYLQEQKGETYIGIVIGVLSVTVLLLLATIVLILRKNRQKIFSKHSRKWPESW